LGEVHDVKVVVEDVALLRLPRREEANRAVASR
jgi:hypothetical protein